MNDATQSYARCKRTGIPWVGSIPDHWDIERAKWLYQKMVRPVSASDGVVTCFRDGTVTLRTNRRTAGFTNSLKEIGYQGVKKGDLVIHAMDAFAGAVGVSDSDGKCTPVYSVCAAKRNVENRYYAYLIREMARSQWILCLARGIRERSTDFRFHAFGEQTVPVPPVKEQKAIADYLDANALKVRRFIRNRRRLIEVLSEQKQAIISRAVTRGLDPNVPLKPSGIDWLGEIPEHWTVMPLKRSCVLVRDGTHLPPERTSAGVPLLSVRNIVDGHFVRRDDDSLISEADYAALCRSFVPRPGDVLMAIVGATMGKVAVVSDIGSFHIQRSLALLRPNPGQLNNRYLSYFLQFPRFQGLLWESVAYSAQPGIYLGTIAAIATPVPPIHEQEQITRKIDSLLAPIASAISRAAREIELIQEYRTRLIADVVTGKVDVRHLAPPPGSEEAEELMEEFADPLDDERGEFDAETLAEETVDADA